MKIIKIQKIYKIDWFFYLFIYHWFNFILEVYQFIPHDAYELSPFPIHNVVADYKLPANIGASRMSSKPVQ